MDQPSLHPRPTTPPARGWAATTRRTRVGLVVVACAVLGTALTLVLAPSGHARPQDRATGTTAGRASGPKVAGAAGAPASSSAPTSAPAPTTTVPPAPPTSRVLSAPYPIADETFTLVDTTRSTPARGSVPATAGRVLRTVVRRPEGPAGPLPVVVFAHGYNGDPETYEPLLDAWAAAGYLVVAPDCPGSTNDLPGTPVQDYAAQARDLSFVITAVLAGRAGPVDPSRVVVAGHSDGGTAVTIMALNPAYADPRVTAYLNLAGQIPPDVPGPWAAGPGAGVLLVAVGDQDQYGNLALSSAMYAAARMPKVMLTVPGGDHLGTFVAATPVAAAVRAATVRFLGAVFASGAGAVTSGQLGQAVLGTDPSPPFTVTSGD